MTAPDWFSGLSTRTKQIAAFLAALAAMWAFLLPVVEPWAKQTAKVWLDVKGNLQCAEIPASGHVIESEKPGQWATVTWYNLRKVDDCGTPELVGFVANGDRIIHTVALSTTGINMPVGGEGSLRYQFEIPEAAIPGQAVFWVTLNYSNVGRSVNSPQIPFTILPSDAP